MARVQTTVTVQVRLQLPSGWNQKQLLNYIGTAIDAESGHHSPEPCPQVISCKITNKETSYA